MNNLNYLSSGELAELVGVSRQIIRHYEQKEILTPAYIDSNGYHYYKPEAYFTLEVVISMRKLDVPLSAIKEFLENRTIETLGAFYWDYLEKLKIIQEQIDIHKNYFQRRLLRLEESKNIPLNTVMIVPTFEYDIICSEEIPIHASLKKRLAALAKFLRPLLKQKEYKDYLFGYLVSLDDITTNKEDAHYHAIINSPLPLDEVKGESVHIRGGLCLSVLFKDDYGRIPAKIIQLIQDYVKHNNLKISNRIHVYAVGDHWCCKSWDDVLCRLYINLEEDK